MAVLLLAVREQLEVRVLQGVTQRVSQHVCNGKIDKSPEIFTNCFVGQKCKFRNDELSAPCRCGPPQRFSDNFMFRFVIRFNFLLLAMKGCMQEKAFRPSNTT